MQKSLYFVLTIMVMVGFISCSEKDKTIPVASISIADATVDVGKTITLTATVTPATATNQTVIWSSSNPALATVNSSSGTVTGVAAGTTTITATATDGSGKSGSCTVTVTPVVIAVTDLELNMYDATLTVGSTLQLSAIVKPDNATDKTVTWSSNNTARATVSATGLVTIPSIATAGEVTILAKTVSGSKEASCAITVINNTLSVNPTSFTFLADETATKTATITTNAQNWNATTTAAWLTIEKQENTLLITPVDLNTESSERSANIVVTAGNANPVVIPVTQAVTSTKLNFNDIVNSTYTATGKPLNGTQYIAPSSWSGNLYARTDEQYYSIYNWADFSSTSYPLFVDYEDGKLFIDNYHRVGEIGNMNIYYAVGYQSGTTVTRMGSTYKYEVSYNKTTNILDFSGTIGGHPAAIFLIGQNKDTGAITLYTIDTALSDVKLLLTPVSSAPATRTNMSSGKSSTVLIDEGGIVLIEKMKSLKELSLEINANTK